MNNKQEPRQNTRANNISENRMKVEAFLNALPEGETATNLVMSEKLGLSKEKVAQIVSSLRIFGLAVNLNPKAGPGMWCMVGKVKKPNRPAPEHFYNGTQPTASQAYWAKNHANAMGTPRLQKEAQ